MNTHKKLLDLGFKPCEPQIVKGNWDNKRFVPDMKNVTSKYSHAEKRWITKVEKKVHPKNLKFYKLEHGDVNIWLKAINNVIRTIWIEKLMTHSNKELIKKNVDIDVIYDKTDINSTSINNKTGILSKLPLNIKRDLIIDELFK